MQIFTSTHSRNHSHLQSLSKRTMEVNGLNTFIRIAFIVDYICRPLLFASLFGFDVARSPAPMSLTRWAANKLYSRLGVTTRDFMQAIMFLHNVVVSLKVVCWDVSTNHLA